MLIGAIILIPLFLSVFSLCAARPRLLGSINAFGYAALLGACLLFTKNFLSSGSLPVGLWGWLYVDSLSVFFLLTTAVVCFAASVYSIGYICCEVKEEKILARKAAVYFQLFNLFCFTMLIAAVLNNVALVWIAIEMTTLVSAFLVGFHKVKESIEAAWKYIIICSVGITFALLGIIFFYYTCSKDAGVNSLEWVTMLAAGRMLDPKIVKIALVFILVGYGTKAGLAPMHNWLPDAHSQALSPVSGLLSGVLLKISLYAILRFVAVAAASVGFDFSARLFVLFGVLSLAVASGFILVQRDLKRLLAYSSVENVGIAVLGFGFGGFGGIFAGLLHIFNHAVTKAFMFFCAGQALRVFKSANISKMRGMLQAMPFTATAMFLGLFALVGMPPFAIFTTKLSVIISAFLGRHYFIAAVSLVFIAVAFAGLLHHIAGIILGNKPLAIAPQIEPLSAKVSLLFLGIFILGLGICIPQPFTQLLLGCQKIILGR